MHSRVPCCAGLNRDIACRHPAWTAGWFAHPVSPGFHPGLFVQVPGPEGRVDSSGRRPAKRTAARCRGFACSMLPGFHPGLFVQVPGPEGRVDSSGRRPAKRTAARGRGFACSTLPGFHPGLFVQVPGPEGRVDSSGRRPAKRTAARCRGFACSMLPGFHPGLFVRVPGPEGRVDSSGRRPAEPLRAPSEDASRAEWESLRLKQSVFPHLTVRASQQPGTTAKDRGERGRKPQPDSTAGDCRSSGASLPTDQVFAGFVAAT